MSTKKGLHISRIPFFFVILFLLISVTFSCKDNSTSDSEQNTDDYTTGTDGGSESSSENVCEEDKQNPAFWLDSGYYTTYDDFEEYPTGPMSTNSKWTVTLSSGSSTVVTSANAGGSGNELFFRAISPAFDNAYYDVILQSNNIPANRHVYLKTRYQASTYMGNDQTAYFAFKIGSGGTYENIFVFTSQDGHGTMLAYPQILMVALGSYKYDVYTGGKKIISSYDASGDNQIYIRLSSSGSSLSQPSVSQIYLDDVRYSTEEIE